MRNIPRYNDETGTYQIVTVTKEAETNAQGEVTKQPEFSVLHDFNEAGDGVAGELAHEKACAGYDYWKRTGEIPLTTKKV